MTWLDRILQEDPRSMVPRILFDPTLESLCAGLPLDDAQALREERAGILEHGGCLPRADAERRAGLIQIPPADPPDHPGEERARPTGQTRAISDFVNLPEKSMIDAARMAGPR